MTHRILYIDFLEKFSGERSAWDATSESNPEKELAISRFMEMLIDENVCCLSILQLKVIGLILRGDSYRGIGKDLGVSQQASRRHYMRALDKIRVYFAKNPNILDDIGLSGYISVGGR